MQKIILWGTGPITQVAYYYLTTDSDFEICGFCVDRKYLTDNQFNGKPVVAFEDIEKKFPPEEYAMAIIMGYKNTNKIREERYLEAKRRGYKFISYISSKSSIDTKDIGENVKNEKIAKNLQKGSLTLIAVFFKRREI